MEYISHRNNMIETGIIMVVVLRMGEKFWYYVQFEEKHTYIETLRKNDKEYHKNWHNYFFNTQEQKYECYTQKWDETYNEKK